MILLREEARRPPLDGSRIDRFLVDWVFTVSLCLSPFHMDNIWITTNNEMASIRMLTKSGSYPYFVMVSILPRQLVY